VRADFIQAIDDRISSIRQYAFDQYSYDQAFDSNMVPIEGKYTISLFHSAVSLYEENLYLSQSEDRMYETPADLLADPEGNYDVSSHHDYYLEDGTDELTSIDDATEGENHSISYAIYGKDLIHSFDLLKNSFGDIPLEPMEAIKGEKTYFDALVSKDPENYVYDEDDPYTAGHVSKNEDGGYRYAFSVHFSLCHYGDEYYLNRRFHYFIDLRKDRTLKDYGYSVEIMDPVTDESGNILSYEADAAKAYYYSEVSSTALGAFSGTLPDIVPTATLDANGNPTNAEGVTVLCQRKPRGVFDSSKLTAADFADAAVIAKLSDALPNYLSGVTSSTMVGSLSHGATGTSYSEKTTRQLYQGAYTSTSGIIIATPYTRSEDDAGTVTFTYGSEETVIYRSTMEETASALTVTHGEDESTIYAFQDPLNGTSPMATFKYDGDFFVPDYLPLDAEDYLDPSMLSTKISGLTLKADQCQVQTDGSLLIVGTDYASDYALTLKDNAISQVVETLLGENSSCYGKDATVTKKYTLTRGDIPSRG
jgi:hypothetical protein